MWNKPWRYAEGWAIGAGLLVTGLILQLATGNVDAAFFRYPVNLLFGGALSRPAPALTSSEPAECSLALVCRLGSKHNVIVYLVGVSRSDGAHSAKWPRQNIQPAG